MKKKSKDVSNCQITKSSNDEDASNMDKKTSNIDNDNDNSKDKENENEVIPKSISFEFCAEVVRRKIAKKTDIEESKKFANLEREKKMLMTHKLMSKKTEYLVSLLWHHSKGKIENIEYLFDAAYEATDEKFTS